MNHLYLTSEQNAILQKEGNIVVTAKPGSGKTHTLVEKIAFVLSDLPDFQGVIAISFTNKASTELRLRCKKRKIIPKNSFWGTIDGFYISQIIKPFASHITRMKPEYSVIDEFPEDSEYQELLQFRYPFDDYEEAMVIKALRNGFIPLNLSGEIALYLLEKVPEVLAYIKARYKYIFIDEYQDCGEIQHKIFTLLVDNGLIGFAVGDIDQAIYGFARRYPKYLLSLIARKDFAHIELSRNFRCHNSISEYSLCLFQASKSIPTEKRVFCIHIDGNECSIAKQIDSHIEQIKNTYGIKNNNRIGVLCRSNSTASLIFDNLKTPSKLYQDSLLDREQSEWGRFFRELLICYFDDSIYSIDFAEQYFSPEYDNLAYSKALNLCNDIFKCAPNVLHEQEEKVIQLAQMIYPNSKNENAVENLHNVLNNDSELNCFAPGKDEELNIMTLHKSKGLEFDIVFHLDMYKYIIPNEYEDVDAQQQYLNLHYVGVTRAIEACYILVGTKRYRKSKDDFVDALPSPFLSIDGLKERRIDEAWNDCP